MRKKHQRVLDSLFKDPVQANIVWHDVELMLSALGAEIKERVGSRVVIECNDIVAVFHRPHPKKETDKGAVKSVRRFLIEAGVKDVKL